MNVFFEKEFTLVDPRKIERCEREIPEEQFALKAAMMFIEDPKLGCGPDFCCEPLVVAHVLGLNINLKSLKYKSVRSNGLRLCPERIEVKNICGNLVRVWFGEASASRGLPFDYYYFRRRGNELEYLPVVKICAYRVEENSPAYPWIYLFPEKFKDVMAFAELLDPGDENPLTGLVSAKDAPVRTLAKQVASKLKTARDTWIRSIVAEL